MSSEKENAAYDKGVADSQKDSTGWGGALDCALGVNYNPPEGASRSETDAYNAGKSGDPRPE